MRRRDPAPSPSPSPLTLTAHPRHSPLTLTPTLTPTPTPTLTLTLSNAQEKDHNLIQQINTLPPGSRVLIFCSTKRMCVPSLAPRASPSHCAPHPNPPHTHKDTHTHAHTHTHRADDDLYHARRMTPND
jgi:hypothetical protein